MNGQPPLGMPPTPAPGLIWRRARKLYVCCGNGAGGRNLSAAPGCARFIPAGQAYLECGWEAEPFHSGSRHCEPCARAFFAEHLDTRSGKEATHA